MKSSQDFIAYFKSNRHQGQEVLTAKKLVKQLNFLLLLFKKQFALSRKCIVTLFITMNIITGKAI